MGSLETPVSHIDRRLRSSEQEAAAARVLAGAADRDAEMRGNLDATAAGQQRIVGLIQSLIDQQNR